MSVLSLWNTLPRATRMVLLFGIAGVVTGALCIRLSQDVSWVRFFDNLHWTTTTSAAAVLAWLGLRSTSCGGPVFAHAWSAAGLAGYAIGQLVWDVQIAIGYSDFPGPADFFYLWLGPCISIGLLLEMFRFSKPAKRIPALLDIFALTVAVLAVVLAVYLPHRGDTGVLAFVALILYPVTLFSAFCIGLALTIELRFRLSLAWLTILLSMMITGLSWMKWNLMALDGVTVDGAWFNTSFSVAVLALGMGVNRWQAEQSVNETYDRLCEGLLRLLPLMSVMLACASIIATVGMDDISEIAERIIYLAAPVVIVLAVIRQVLQLRERDQLLEAQGALAREEAALRASEERFRTLILATTQMVWTTNALGEVIHDLPSWRAYTGQSMDEVKGWGWIKALHPDDVERTGAIWKQSVETRSVYQTEYRLRRHDGVYCLFRVRGVPVYESDGTVREWVGTCSDITEFKRTEELIWRQANFDPLTELPNRRMFRDRLEQEVKKSDRSGLPLAFLLIDLDHFKEVNDTMGHDVGDMMLQQAAQRICECVRQSDTVARLGGDEFTVILTEVTGNEQIGDIAQKVISRLAAPFYLGEETAFVSASIGITLYPSDTPDVNALLKNADQAMYAAKSKGRNRFSYFTQSLQDTAQSRMRLSNDLRNALAASQFMVYFQPIVELKSGHTRKAEALLRWKHPEHGMVAPDKFIPLAETTGVIVEIGDWVFRSCADWVARWEAKHGEKFQVSVNMSPVQFNSRKDIFDAWDQHLKQSRLYGNSIVLEITEGLLLNAETIVMERLYMLRDIGIEVAIDDFGTGYSSLSYLKKFHIDYLKIDQSFTRDLEVDADDRALCEAIIVMAHKLGLRVIAEGVETEGQRDLLLAMGCDYGQGYLFSRPMPEREFEAYLGARAG